MKTAYEILKEAEKMSKEVIAAEADGIDAVLFHDLVYQRVGVHPLLNQLIIKLLAIIFILFVHFLSSLFDLQLG